MLYRAKRLDKTPKLNYQFIFISKNLRLNLKCFYFFIQLLIYVLSCILQSYVNNNIVNISIFLTKNMSHV